MTRTQRLSLAGILFVGAAIGTIACGGTAEKPSAEDATLDVSVETVSLKVEGMT